MAGGLQGSDRRRVERHAEDVLLALKLDAVQRDVIGAARGLERAGAGRERPYSPALEVLLRREVRRDGRREQLVHVELSAALLLPVGGVELVAARDQHLLNLVWCKAGVALQKIGDYARGKGGRLGGAAAAEVVVTQNRARIVLVDVGARDAETLHVRAGREQVRRATACRCCSSQAPAAVGRHLVIRRESRFPSCPRFRPRRSRDRRLGRRALERSPLSGSRSCPAAATTTMPAFQACSTAYASGSTVYG